MAPTLTVADAAPETATVWKSKKRFYKQTRLCSFNLVGACKRGAACNFAHTEQDLKEMPDFSKTRICKNFMAGKCELGSACSFAHGQQELIQVKKTNKKDKELTKKPTAFLGGRSGSSASTCPSDGEEGSLCSLSDACLSAETLLFDLEPALWQSSRLDSTGQGLIISL
mmetsp:Transcript_5358/g.12590  ORF Transcript_5358/g.12590 Transcript_5358/m.12590 type:complete len:169 (+) Transcript_5358:102-608(+)